MPEITFDPQKVGFALVTSYPKWYSGKLRSIKHVDKVRGDLALEFITKARKLGCHVVVADKNSAKTFMKEIKVIQGVHLIKRRSYGSGQGKRKAIDKVHKIFGVEVIILSEAEKVSVVTNCLELIALPILEGKADIVVPRRNDELFKSTYPEYMYNSEIEGNTIYNETLRSHGILSKAMPNLDWCFGPRAFRNDKNIIRIFKRKYVFNGISCLENLYDTDQYSNIQFFPIITALKRKLSVMDVKVPFSYPQIQKENEDIGAREVFVLKRSLQRVAVLIDLMHFLSYLEGRRSSKLRLVT